MHVDERGWARDLLRCPLTGSALIQEGASLVASDLKTRYRIAPGGIPLFAEAVCSEAARSQQAHYEKIASAYVSNLGYPHTRVYMRYLDEALLAAIAPGQLGVAAEICCGAGEAFKLVGDRIERGLGVDVSVSMLQAAAAQHRSEKFAFIQADAIALPLSNECCDNIFMLGGIHHVADRMKLFAEVARVLKPGGRFYFREPVSDFALWRALRSVIYRISPVLDHETERPLLYDETEPFLDRCGLGLQTWRTIGFFGFCLFMNSDVLVFNRLFRFFPMIEPATRLAVRIDDWMTRRPALRRAGLQVIGVAEKRAVGA